MVLCWLTATTAPYLTGCLCCLAFAFFAAPAMTSFYKRFVRDFMRYKDDIQCPGAELVAAIRADVRAVNPANTAGEYYALHIRRGDLQFKVFTVV